MRLICLIFFCVFSHSIMAANQPSTNQSIRVSDVVKQLFELSHQQASQQQTDKQRQAQRAIVFQSLRQLDTLIRAGLPGLALSLLETQQKKRQTYTVGWYAFEYKRIVIYAAMENWSALNKRVDWLLQSTRDRGLITEKIALWFETQQVIARLQSGRASLALRQLERLIWTHDIDHINRTLPAVWRRLVIRAYVRLQLYEDAQKALVKYNQDFKQSGKDTDWQLLQVRILLRTGRPQQAAQVLATIQPEHLSATSRALKLLAELQSDTQAANQQQGLTRIQTIAAQLDKRLNGSTLQTSTRWAYAYVAYRAAVILNNPVNQIRYLEIMLSLAPEHPVPGKNYTVSADALWQLYRQAGLLIANKHNLLIGDDQSWLALIKTEKAGGQALYLNVALAFEAKKTVFIQLANAAIVSILAKKKNGLTLIDQLYFHSNQIHDITVLPVPMRYRLVDYDLHRGAIKQASRLMDTLPEPPQGQSLFDWRLRKARLLVFEGKYQQSYDLLYTTLSPLTELNKISLDRYIQVVFDFQTVQQHRQALRLFDLIKPEWLNGELKREIYFWKAQSYAALNEQDMAALFYLRSAQALAGKENDLWGQSARFKAAGALVKAGIYTDAEKVYRDLLAITVTESRKLLIKQNLQHIKLLKRAQQIKQHPSTSR